jgi:hypothetical protein
MTVEQLQSKPLDTATPPTSPSNLAQRNLLRGMAMGLPSGQDVALAMGLEPIEDKNLRIGKAVLGDWDKNPSLTKTNQIFEGKAPLWYYILAEAQFEWVQKAKAGKKDEEPMTLGTVGGRIVAETLIGLLLADGHSYLRQAPNWKPDTIRTMGDLIAMALS